MPRLTSLVSTAVAVAAACLTVGCAAEPEAPPSSSQSIIGGERTSERPEVGILVLDGDRFTCTAALVGPRLVLTAAHCVDWSASLPAGLTFVAESRGVVERTTVSAVRVLTTDKGSASDKDLALLRLSHASKVRPARIAESDPKKGTPMTTYGSGCEDRGDGAIFFRGALNKQRFAFEWGKKTNVGCYGDSGGPTFREDTGALARVTSGFIDLPFDRWDHDVRGNPVKHRQWIVDTAAALGEPL